MFARYESIFRKRFKIAQTFWAAKIFEATLDYSLHITKSVLIPIFTYNIFRQS